MLDPSSNAYLLVGASLSSFACGRGALIERYFSTSEAFLGTVTGGGEFIAIFLVLIIPSPQLRALVAGTFALPHHKIQLFRHRL